MKRLNLNETWVLCLKMWKWLIEQIEAGDTSSVPDLKIKWVKKHGIKKNSIDANCHFCEYNTKAGGRYPNCKYCPGKKIAKDFFCEHEDYYYQNNPIAFYKKLVELNKIRLAKRKEK